jgi:two-component system LytT family response regulator
VEAIPKIRSMIVEDEPLARRRLRAILQAEPDVELLAECRDPREAAEVAREQDPDVLFVDVHTPRGDTLQMLERLESGHVPEVIFVTPPDQHALRAFESHDFDYVVRPFDPDRVREALRRARVRLDAPEAGARRGRLEALLGDLKARRAYPARLAVRSAGRVLFVDVAEIDWIEACANYLRLHAGKTTHLVRETMARIEARMDPARFLRIHRSAIVAVDRVREIRPLFSGAYAVLLRDGTKLTLSRGYRERIRDLVDAG